MFLGSSQKRLSAWFTNISVNQALTIEKEDVFLWQTKINGFEQLATKVSMNPYSSSIKKKEKKTNAEVRSPRSNFS